MTLLGTLAAIPDVVWSGLVGAIIALAGVLVANRSNTARLQLQLEHDERQRIADRKASLRRDVYLPAAEALARASHHLGVIPSIDLTKSNPADGLQDFFGSAAKVQLVCEAKTAVAATKVVSGYSELAFRLTSASLSLQEARTDITLYDDMYQREQAEIGRVLGALTQLRESGQANEPVRRQLCASFAFHDEQARKHAEQRGKAWQQYSSKQLQITSRLVPELKPLMAVSVDLMVEIRRELGLETDPDMLTRLMSDNLQRLARQVDEFVEEVAKRIDEDDKSSEGN